MSNKEQVDDVSRKLSREKINFAKIASSSTPLMMIKDSISSKSRYSIRADRVKSALERRDVVELRNISQYFYFTSGEYRRLVQYAAQLLTFDYLIVPRVESKELTKPAFKKTFDNILAYAKNSSIEDTSYEIAFAVVRDGVYFGYEHILGNEQITLQQLPTDFCRTRYKVNGIYQVEFDNKYFEQFTTEKDREEAFAGFPPEFEANYKAYLKDTDERWIGLDPQFARAHLLNDAVPMFSAVFDEILELDEYKTLDKTKMTLSLYTLLVQKIPLNKDNELALYMEEITDLHSNARKMIKNEAIDVLTTPCDMDAITIDSGANSRVERDNIDKATNMIYSSAGTPIALFNAGSHTGSIGLELSVRVDESLMFPLLKQFERWYNNKFIELSPTFEFGMLFPPTTIFNFTKRADAYLEAATYGFPTKMLALTSLGVRQFDADFLLNYENNSLNLTKRMKPLSSSHTASKKDSDTGRPTSEEPLTDEGDRTREGDKNDDRAKEE